MKSTQIVVSDQMIDTLVEKLQELKANSQKVIQLKGTENQVVFMHERFEKVEELKK